MSSEDNTVNSSSLDNRVSAAVKDTPVPLEQYNKNSHGDRIANKHAPDTSTRASNVKSWTLSEIERVVATDTLPVNKQKLVHFGGDLARKNDFRLKELSRRLGRQIGHDFESEIKAGPVANRVRQFDIQSQSMRLISANAALGSLQFQKSQVLPYMRKSLALSYEKVNLLKRVVSGVTSVERALSTKLEAIKMNTAALSPKKETLFGRLKKAISDKKIDRVATNISDFVMDGYGQTYAKNISPIISRLNAKIQQPGQYGGLNGVNRTLTNRINAMRRGTRQFADQDPSTLGAFGRLQQSAARAAGGVLGGVVKMGQRTKLSASLNDNLTQKASPWLSRVDKFNPFTGVDTADKLKADGDFQMGGRANAVIGGHISRLIEQVRGNRIESKEHNKKLLGHVIAIRQHIAPTRAFLTSGTKPNSAMNIPMGSNRSDPMKNLVGSLNTKLDSVKVAIQQTGADRTRFEKFQIKKAALLEKISLKGKLRQGSWEDQQAKKKRVPASPWGPRKSSGIPILGGLFNRKDKDEDDDDGGFLSSLKDKATDKLSDAGSSMAQKAKDKLKRGMRRRRVSMRRGRMRGVGRLAGGAKMFSKGPLALALGAGITNHFLQGSDAESGTKSAGNTLLSMAQYAGMGASFGGPWGAAAGAAVGLLVQNSDYASSQLKGMGDHVGAAASGLVTTLFGRDAKFDRDGQLIQKEKTSLLQDIRYAVFGRKARYTRDGQMVSEARPNLMGTIQYGFEKLLFGDRFSNGQFKEGTSVAAMLRDGLRDGMVGFKRQLDNLPKDLVEGFKKGDLVKGSVAFKDRVVKETTNTGTYLNKMLDQDKKSARSLMTDLSNSKSISIDAAKNATVPGVSKFASAVAFFTSPASFLVNLSNATLGWTIDSGYIDNPSSPMYNYVTEVLNGYGIKNRDQYRFITSLESSQDKINKGQSKPFDDSDMAYMSERFGFDPKNKDAFNYFKLWYKRRFMPGMLIVTRVLKAYGIPVGGAMSADAKQMALVTQALKREFSSSDLKSSGLELSPQAFNKFSKSGSTEPGKTSTSALNSTKPYDPRDPKNRDSAGGGYQARNYSANYDDPYARANAGNDNSMGMESAARKRAAMAKGMVKDQPEFKAAFQNLDPKIKKMVSGSKPLQFVLWSTAVQHGPKVAAEIFQRDYSDQLDEKGYIRSIYQDRSTKFSNLSGSDRSEAVSHLGEEQRYAMGIVDGSSNISRGTMSSMVNNTIDPSGNSNLSYDSSGITPQRVTGDVASRARDAIQFFMSKGYSKAAAAGVVANLITESKLRTNAIGDSGRAHGIAQWHPDRRSAISRQFGKSIEAMNFREQLAAVDWEMRSGKGVSGGKNLVNALNGMPDAGAAARSVMNNYERPAERVNNGRERASIAMGLMKNLASDGGVTPPTTRPANDAAPAARAQAARPAATRSNGPANNNAKPKAQPSAPQTHDSAAWATAIGEHAKAMKASTEAMTKAFNGPMAKPNNIAITPIIQRPQTAGGFIAMNMRKAQVAVGEM